MFSLIVNRRAQRLEALIEVLRPLRHDPQAERYYEAFTDVFHWSDELPEEHDLETWRLAKGLFVYRDGLIRGRAVRGMEHTWRQVQAACPLWPGFRPERRDPSLVAELDAAV